MVIFWIKYHSLLIVLGEIAYKTYTKKSRWLRFREIKIKRSLNMKKTVAIVLVAIMVISLNAPVLSIFKWMRAKECLPIYLITSNKIDEVPMEKVSKEINYIISPVFKFFVCYLQIFICYWTIW